MSSKDGTRTIGLLIEDLRRKGWRVESGRSGHNKAYPPDKTKPVVAFQNTPGDWRAQKNLRSVLRKSGYDGDVLG